MVRLVFRPYTQVRKAICTSAHLRASTRVSSGFALLRHSSPSFGSQQPCSDSNPSQKIKVGRWCAPRRSHRSGYLRLRVCHPPTRTHVRLLGPCFKTGRAEALRQRHERAGAEARVRARFILSLHHGAKAYPAVKARAGQRPAPTADQSPVPLVARPHPLLLHAYPSTISSTF